MNIILKNINSIAQMITRPLVDAGVKEGNSNSAQQQQSQFVGNFNFDKTIQLNKLDLAQTNMLLKELLNLPKEWKDLLSLLSAQSSNGANKSNDMNSKILLAAIQNLLASNSKDVINKLLKLIQPNSSNIQNIDQVRDIIGLLSKAMPSASSLPQESFKELALLYLPWLPLAVKEKIEMEFMGSEGSSGQEDESSLMIYLETENLGRFKVQIINAPNSEAVLIIDHYAQTEVMNYQELVKSLTAKLKDENISADIRFKTNVESLKQKDISSQTSEKINTNKKSVTLSANQSTSIKTIMISHIVIAFISKLDQKMSLLLGD